jgi:hypothetical protein
LRSTDLKTAIFAQILVAQIALLSCGIFVGMAFGFLGFALFLLGIRAEMDVDARSEVYQMKLARLSPGVFVLLCAAVMITFCATHESEFGYRALEQPGAAWQRPPAPAVTPKPSERQTSEGRPPSFDDDYNSFAEDPKMGETVAPSPARSDPTKKEMPRNGGETSS